MGRTGHDEVIEYGPDARFDFLQWEAIFHSIGSIPASTYPLTQSGKQWE
jgi:hypothetical protein